MASPVSTPTVCCSSSLRKPGKSSLYPPSAYYCLQSDQSTRRFPISKRFSQLGNCCFTSWTGLRNLGLSLSSKSLVTGKKERCKGLRIRASLFGVGAPEALVIGVVALLVFGPKGLAEVARNLGKTLRAFQPTIRELQDVSREFKSTLEREIGLDDVQNPSQSAYGSSRTNSVSNPPTSGSESPQIMSDPNGAPPNRAYSSEEYLKITEEQLQASVSLQDKAINSTEDQTNGESQAKVQEATGESPSPLKPENRA
ncbi:hypothetical protein V2J09_011254 [Rumex salicifolius]